MRNVTLILDDGSRFPGKSFGYEKPVAGEVVFNTAMTGYPESLTDPSYAGQLMTLTYPLVGNYGVPPFTIEPNGLATFMESDGASDQGTALDRNRDGWFSGCLCRSTGGVFHFGKGFGDRDDGCRMSGIRI